MAEMMCCGNRETQTESACVLNWFRGIFAVVDVIEYRPRHRCKTLENHKRDYSQVEIVTQARDTRRRLQISLRGAIMVGLNSKFL